MQQEELIVGLNSIAQFIGRSRPTVLLMIKEDGLPAVKLQGRWMSSRDMLVGYIRDKIVGNVDYEHNTDSSEQGYSQQCA